MDGEAVGFWQGENLDDFFVGVGFAKGDDEVLAIGRECFEFIGFHVRFTVLPRTHGEAELGSAQK